MELQELEITIDKNGRVHIFVAGVKGDRCLALTRDLESALGTVEERNHTSEYYEESASTDTHHYIGSR